MEAPKIIGKSIMNDQNNDGNLGNVLKNVVAAGMPFYSNMIAHPQLAIDEDDNLYISYTTAVDGHYVPPIVTYNSSNDNGATIKEFTQTFEEETILYTDIFMLKSTNKGTTWQGPLNVTNTSASEETYPSIQRFIKDTIFLVYQRDVLPGNLSKGSQNLACINEIVVAKILPGDISDEVAPPDSEPYLSVLYTDLTVAQNCNINIELNSRRFGWGLDYPEGLLTEIKSRGFVDYSQTGNFIDEIYVEDGVGNQSDPVQISVKVVPGAYHPPNIGEFDCEE